MSGSAPAPGSSPPAAGERERLDVGRGGLNVRRKQLIQLRRATAGAGEQVHEIVGAGRQAEQRRQTILVEEFGVIPELALVEIGLVAVALRAVQIVVRRLVTFEASPAAG